LNEVLNNISGTKLKSKQVPLFETSKEKIWHPHFNSIRYSKAGSRKEIQFIKVTPDSEVSISILIQFTNRKKLAKEKIRHPKVDSIDYSKAGSRMKKQEVKITPDSKVSFPISIQFTKKLYKTVYTVDTNSLSLQILSNLNDKNIYIFDNELEDILKKGDSLRADDILDAVVEGFLPNSFSLKEVGLQAKQAIESLVEDGLAILNGDNVQIVNV